VAHVFLRKRLNSSCGPLMPAWSPTARSPCALLLAHC